MSGTRKLVAILVADVVGYSRLATLLLTLLLPAAQAGGAGYYGYDQGGSRFAPARPDHATERRPIDPGTG